MEITFIAGIHGVGKTYYTKSLNDNIPTYSASDLIRKYKNIEGKKTKKIGENQNLLLNAISDLKEKEIYLDGHFCLLNKNEEITRIPINIFKELKLKRIILIHASIEKIIERLYQRDSQKYDKKLLEKFQQEEIEYGKEIAKELNIELQLIEN